MIELTPLARPYAKAMFAAALDDKSLEETSSELETIALVTKSPEVASAIEDPTLSRKQVVNLLLELFNGEISNKSKKLLSILAENKRLNLFETIFVLYTELIQEHKKQNSIEVFVASNPSEDARLKIEERLHSSYGSDAKITFLKDPKMMGGLTIKVGDETLDLSIKGKVNKLVNQLNF